MAQSYIDILYNCCNKKVDHGHLNGRLWPRHATSFWPRLPPVRPYISTSPELPTHALIHELKVTQSWGLSSFLQGTMLSTWTAIYQSPVLSHKSTGNESHALRRLKFSGKFLHFWWPNGAVVEWKEGKYVRLVDYNKVNLILHPAHVHFIPALQQCFRSPICNSIICPTYQKNWTKVDSYQEIYLLRLCSTISQNLVSFGHSQKIWRQVPSNSQQWQQVLGIWGNLRCNATWVLYHLARSL